VKTPLYDAGVDRGDLILRLDGRPIRNRADIDIVMRDHQPGDLVEIEYEQRERVVRSTLKLMENRWLEVVPYEDAGLSLTPEQRTFRASWLSSRNR
jgi:predicted metalloprotease with PDZ domain